jgi:c-di-GMP-binding flagellar brake protein YcgR
MTKTSEMFSHNSKDQRKFFRVRPSNREPVFIELTGKNIQVSDISAGGIAFKNHKLKEGQDQSIKINLPDRITIESVKIRILSIDGNNICHTRFIEMESSERDKIHRYTLKRQVEIAKKNKEVKYRNWHTRV